MKTPKKIVVIGSCNTDLIIKTERFPQPGETVLGSASQMESGGKGANQAIAAARLGGRVTLISKIGYDLFGLQAMELYRNEHINTEYIVTDPRHPSGMAMIAVNSSGENYVIVSPGANATLGIDDIRRAEEEIVTADIVLMQLEIPMATAAYAIDMAHSHGVRVVLNPAPVPPSISDELLSKLYAITPNRIEAGMISGIKVTDMASAASAAQAISDRGVENVVITLGRDGVYLKDGDVSGGYPACPVDAIDTTGAGDVFCGAFCVYIAEGHSITDAVKFATSASSLVITRIGAQCAIPYRHEVGPYTMK